MSDIARYVESNADRFREELFEYLRIPSVSTDPRHAADIERCAAWVADRVREAGLESVEVVPTAGHPIVIGEHVADPEAPTLLLYGHYDVQPPDPEEEWESPPFEPTVRDGRVYARGATDNKGQNHMHLKALETCLRATGSIPVNLRIVIEGEEEIGSEHVAALLEEESERLSCDAVVLSDTGMFARDVPSITVGLRGIVYFEVEIRGPATDLHSGVYGGPVVNPANALAAVLAALKDDRGRVTVPGFYDDVRPATEEERRRLAELPFDREAFIEEVGVPALGGEEGYGPLELIGYRPSLDVNGLLAGFTGEGAKTVLPARAMAKVSMRLVPDQDPEVIGEAFADHVRSLAPQGVKVSLRPFQHGPPWAEEPRGPLFEVAAEALEEGFGRRPVYVREGGSIPLLPLLSRTFGVPILPIGFALPGANQHAPNEWLDLEVYRRAVEALANFYAKAARLEKGALKG